MYQFQLKEVSRIYKVDKEVDFYALKNISLTLQGPGFISIIGKSGSGKSTILNLLGGLDKASEGEVTYEGKNMSRLKEKERSKFYKKKIGILFQNYNLVENESTLFNVLLPQYICGVSKKQAKKKAIQTLQLVGIEEELFHKNAAVLSDIAA